MPMVVRFLLEGICMLDSVFELVSVRAARFPLSCSPSAVTYFSAASYMSSRPAI